MSSDVHCTNTLHHASQTRPQNQTDVLSMTNSGQIKGLFYKATNFVIHGGTYSVVGGNLHSYVGSTHNERSGNSRVANTTGSYNDSSTNVRKEYTRSEASAVDGTEIFSRAFIGEGRELGTGKMVSGEGTSEIQERRQRLANAALRRISRKPSCENPRGDAPQQSKQEQPVDVNAPNGDAHRGFFPSPPHPSSDSNSVSAESDGNDTDTDEMFRSVRTKRRKRTMSKKLSVHETMPAESQVPSQNLPGFFASTSLQSPIPDSNINVRMQDPFGVSQMQSPCHLVAHQAIPRVLGYPFALHGTAQAPPALPHPQPWFPPRPMPSKKLNVDSNPYWKSTNPFAPIPALPLTRDAEKRDEK